MSRLLDTMRENRLQMERATLAPHPHPSEQSLAKRMGLKCPASVRLEILYRYNGRCYLCGVEEWRTRSSFEMHRVTPGRAGGLYILDNLVPVCAECHPALDGKTWAQIEPLRLARHGEADHG